MSEAGTAAAAAIRAKRRSGLPATSTSTVTWPGTPAASDKAACLRAVLGERWPAGTSIVFLMALAELLTEGPS